MDVAVRHTTGTLAIEDSDLVAGMSGTSGLFRKQSWAKTDRTPIAQVRRLTLQKEVRGGITLVIHTLRSGDQAAVAYMDCGPEEALEDLLEELVEANPQITVNDVDVGAEVRRLMAEREAVENEIVGVAQRATLTRLALGSLLGPVGTLGIGLGFKKTKAVRRKDVR